MFSWFVTNRRLRTEIREYRREIEELKLEWEEWFDKFRRLYARLSRRVARQEQDEPDEPGPAVEHAAAPGQQSQLTLSDRQRAINDDILKRRHRAV